MNRSVSEDDRRFLGRAVELAFENIRTGRGGPFGALLVRDGQVFAEGANQVVPSCDPTAHAEVVAIRRAALLAERPHLQDCTLYASCEPCPMCLASAYWARIPRIVYALSRQDAEAMGFSDAEIYEQIPLDPDKRALRCEKLVVPEAAKLIEQWNHLDGRHPY